MSNQLQVRRLGLQRETEAAVRAAELPNTPGAACHRRAAGLSIMSAQRPCNWVLHSSCKIALAMQQPFQSQKHACHVKQVYVKRVSD